MRNVYLPIAVPATMVTLLLATQNIHAQIVPFKSIGVNNVYYPISGEFGGSGITSHMGKTTGTGNVNSVFVDQTGNPWILSWEGEGEFVAPNGDKLYFATDPLPADPADAVNMVQLDVTNFPICTAVWSAKFHITGGTGRFANAGPASEPLDVIAVNHPFNILEDTEWLYDYTITGKINLGKRK